MSPCISKASRIKPEAALIDKRGAASRPPCTRAVVVVNFAWARELNDNFLTTTAWLQGFPPLLLLKTMLIFGLVDLHRFDLYSVGRTAHIQSQTAKAVYSKSY